MLSVTEVALKSGTGWHWLLAMKIRKSKKKGARHPWMLDGNFGGRWIRQFFRTEREAAEDRLSPKERSVEC